MKNADRYSDIINLPHHQSATRPHMSNYERAAQFSPFAALKGYDDEIKEAQSITENKRELTEEQIAKLNEKLILLKSIEKEQPLVKIVYFELDGRKYLTIEDKLIGVDEFNQKLIFSDKKMAFENIFDIICKD